MKPLGDRITETHQAGQPFLSQLAPGRVHLMVKKLAPSTPAEAPAMRARPFASLALCLAVSLSAGSSALAWGALGHRLTARVAEKHLTPEARAAVKELLEDGESLAEASLWADQHKREIRGSAPWHYVNVPIDEPRYDAKFCPKGGCVVSKLAECISILKDKRKPRAERQRALRFVVHLVGDLHQPLHVGDNHDSGGNRTQVRFFGRGTNMHSVWDSAMPDRSFKSGKSLIEHLDELDTDENRKAWGKGSIDDWANESLAAAKVAYLIPEIQERIRSGDVLGEDYLEASLATARERQAKAGVRLATDLNEALGEAPYRRSR